LQKVILEPKYIENAKKTNLPLHRIVDTEGGLIEKYVPNQSNLLQKEGVKIMTNADLFSSENKAFVNLKESLWLGAPLYQN
jgi:alkylated DNA nucleotide flippase Atl1